jgi:hypothetical protein
MNQDQVKGLLKSLDDTVPDFTVVFTGKESRRVDGLYKPATKEILIHNRNFQDDNSLIYTAVHEFAHHVHFTMYPDEVVRRAHTSRFWELFHGLLSLAEEKNMYRKLFETDPAFKAITQRIQNEFIGRNGTLMKEFGKLLLEAVDLCHKKHAIFEDYAERTLGLTRGSAKTLMKVYSLDLDESLGFENMKMLTRIPDARDREGAAELFRSGKTPVQVRQQFRESRVKIAPGILELETEKRRLERSISILREKLENVEIRLQEIGREAL